MYQLSEPEQGFLLEIARRAVQAHLFRMELRLPEIPPGPIHEPSGVFVSVQKAGQLRGCVGSTRAVRPLYRSVAECAVAAGSADPRFAPVGRDELPDVCLEISVLSMVEGIEDVSSIQVGVHGLLIQKNGLCGLLLPQVAMRYGWDRLRFLEEACAKAGLGRDDWKADASIHIFTAQVFGEHRQEPPGNS